MFSLMQLRPKRYSISFACLHAMLIMAGCNASENTHMRLLENKYDPPDLYLSIRDSIGVEVGDSNYVIGSPSFARMLPQQRVLIVDHIKKSVSLYSSEGEYLAQVGKCGGGPGEYVIPSWVALTPSGGFAVNDVGGRAILFFTEECVYSGRTGIFETAVPSNTAFLSDTSFIGSTPVRDFIDGDLHAGYAVSLFSINSNEPLLTYYSELALFNGENPLSIDALKPSTAISDDGVIFIAPRSQDQYCITAYTAQGDTLFQIQEAYSRLEKTEDVIIEETARRRAYLEYAGAPAHIVNNFNAQKYYYAINSIGIGPDSNLWVSLGFTAFPTFLVYSSTDGTYLYSAVLENHSHVEDMLVFPTKYGITAVDHYSDSWPRVFLIEIDSEPNRN